MKRSQKIIQLLMALVTVVGLLAPAAMAVTPKQAAAVSPQLTVLAAENPEQMVRVIVQKADDSNRAEQLVERLGGQVLRDLGLINAFAALLPADQVVDLARLQAVAAISLDAPVVSTASKEIKTVDTPTRNYYLETTNAYQAWKLGYDGTGITVAVIDSGITPDADFGGDEWTPGSHLLLREFFSPNATTKEDETGHGTHVAGIIAGAGADSKGMYMGVAPGADLISLKISDDAGMAYESDTVAAMQWVSENKDQYNIRVVNLSIQSTVESSYHDSPLNAAAEILWFNGIVVIAAAGNKSEDVKYEPSKAAPANDPFVITVGATDEKGDGERSNDSIASFTSFVETVDFFIKPEILAPGKDIISVLATNSDWDEKYPDREVLDGQYFRISGTSMAAPMVSGAAAILLQAEPYLTPDQVKFRLLETAGKVGKGGYLDIFAALTTETKESANQGIMPHKLLAQMALIAYWANQNGEEDVDWANVDWSAVNWTAVNWNAVNWNAVNWNAVNWNAVNWNAVNWNAVNWNAVNWNAVNWNAVNWNAVNWNAVNWNAVNWNAVNWTD
jgi:serine protease AprX